MLQWFWTACPSTCRCHQCPARLTVVTTVTPLEPNCAFLPGTVSEQLCIPSAAVIALSTDFGQHCLMPGDRSVGRWGQGASLPPAKIGLVLQVLCEVGPSFSLGLALHCVSSSTTSYTYLEGSKCSCNLIFACMAVQSLLWRVLNCSSGVSYSRTRCCFIIRSTV